MYPTKKLWEICEIKTWKKDANYSTDDWKYPFFTCWREILKSPWYSFDTDAILIAWNWDVWACKKFKWKFEAYQRTYVLDNFQNIEKNFLFYFLDWNLKKELLNETLWSAIPYIKLWSLQNREIPLPPLPTQQKIVSKLDSLFEKLDQAITLTKQNLANVEELNKSVLEKIFKECEEKYWSEKIENILEICEYWSSEKAFDYLENWIPILRMLNIQNWKIDYNDLKFCSKNSKNLPKLFLKKYDLLFNRTNSWELVWKTWIFEWNDNEVSFAWYLVRLRFFKNKALQKFWNYFLNSNDFRKEQLEKQIDQTAGQANFSASKLKNCTIPLPPLSEQQKIVEYLDNIFAKNKILQEKYKQDLQNLEELKQSILKQAFEDEDFIK